MASAMRDLPKYYGSYGHIKLEQSDDDSGPEERKKKSSSKPLPKDSTDGGVLTGAGPEALTTLTNSLSKQSRYKKLVDDDDDLMDLGQLKPPKRDDDMDSIGNADDLKVGGHRHGIRT